MVAADLFVPGIGLSTVHELNCLILRATPSRPCCYNPDLQMRLGKGKFPPTLQLIQGATVLVVK